MNCSRVSRSCSYPKDKDDNDSPQGQGSTRIRMTVTGCEGDILIRTLDILILSFRGHLAYNPCSRKW